MITLLVLWIIVLMDDPVPVVIKDMVNYELSYKRFKWLKEYVEYVTNMFAIAAIAFVLGVVLLIDSLLLTIVFKGSGYVKQFMGVEVYGVTLWPIVLSLIAVIYIIRKAKDTQFIKDIKEDWTGKKQGIVNEVKEVYNNQFKQILTDQNIQVSTDQLMDAGYQYLDEWRVIVGLVGNGQLQGEQLTSVLTVYTEPDIISKAIQQKTYLETIDQPVDEDIQKIIVIDEFIKNRVNHLKAEKENETINLVGRFKQRLREVIK